MAVMPFKKKVGRPKNTTSGSTSGGGNLTQMDHGDFVELYQKSRRARRPMERDWYLNLAFLNGEQYVEFVLETNRLVPLVNDEGNVRALRNAMFKIARNERAKLMKVPLQPICLPLSDEQDDLMQAKIGTAFFKWLMHQWKFERRLRTAYYWVIATGNVFLKWYWAAGRNQMAVIAPFDIFPDPYARNMLDCRWLIHQQFMEVETARAMFKGVKGANLDCITEDSFDAISPAESDIFLSYHDGFANLPGSVIKEYWEPPSAECPSGRHTVFTNTGIVLDEKYPLLHGRLPFTHIGHVERANSKWYSSVLDPIRPLQMELNRTESQLIENRNLANGKWFIPVGMELNEPPNATPRQVMYQTAGDPNQRPEFIAVQPLPPEVWNEPNRIQAAMEDLAGQHEVSNAGVPGRIESAQAVMLLQETEDSVLKDTIDSAEEAIADGFWLCLADYKQFGDPELLVEVWDKAGMVEVEKLLRDKLDLAARVICQSTTALPSSTAGKWDRVLNLYQYKIIDAPTALKLLGLTPEDPDLDPAEMDRKVAYRENQEMIGGVFDATGVPTQGIVRANKWDNHGAHREEHDKFRKSAEYQMAVKADPRVAQLFDFHDEEHRQLDIEVAVEQAQKQAAVQQALQPQPPPMPPQGPPPGAPPAGPPHPPVAPQPAPPAHLQ